MDRTPEREREIERLEHGRIAFLLENERPILVLRPAGGARERVIVVGRKQMPNPRMRERFWALVHRVGEGVAGDAPEIAAGRYAIARHDGHAHLVYQLERKRRANLIVTVANPDPVAWEQPPIQRELFADLRAGVETPTPFPPELQERFRGRRYTELEPDYLDHPGAELILMAVPETIEVDLGD
jgi:hypothetical protein